MSSLSEATACLKYLSDEANSILGELLHSPVVPLDTGSSGMFPYNFQNSANPTLFNYLTYNWIKTNLKSGANPATLDSGVFSNEYIKALGSIVWSLSSKDHAALNDALKNATQQQAAFLSAWQAAGYTIPPATKTLQPIDIVVNTIATTWANPPTTLTAMQNAPNLRRLLNNIPASGQPIIPVLSNWLNALAGAIGLENNVSMNNGYLASALQAVQQPVAGVPASGGNGGMLVDNNTTVPAFTVSPPQMSDIQNGLAGGSSFTMTMDVSRSSQSEVAVSITGGGGFTIPVADFFGISAGGSASYFSDQIATSSNTVSIDMTFTGVTPVSFGPLPYDQSSGLGWAWFDPIREAIKNYALDPTGNSMSGFKFSPNPAIDFGTSGPFGFVNGLVICNYPTIKITITSANWQSIMTTFQSQTSMSVSFLGIPLATSTQSYYNSSASQGGSANTIVITLSPPQAMVASTLNNSLAWILGADINYPCA